MPTLHLDLLLINRNLERVDKTFKRFKSNEYNKKAANNTVDYIFER